MLFIWLLLPGLAAPRAQAASADLLQKVLDQGRLRCGVSKFIPGLAVQDKSGAWSGMDVDVCRALAAALFGSADKARFVPLSAVERFPALLAGRVDLISGSTTWTLAREVGLKVSFVGPVVFSA
ncbi:MAG: transporter substrate-binding domain-containing protein, partial [Gammaproteobacteria bacterium]